MEPVRIQDHLSDEVLSTWLDGALAEYDALAADQHLGSCRQCAARYAGLRATRDALRHLDPVPLPRDFRLPDDGPRRPHIAKQPTSLLPWIAGRFVSAAVTLCGLILLALALLNSIPAITSQHFANVSAARGVPAGSIPQQASAPNYLQTPTGAACGSLACTPTVADGKGPFGSVNATSTANPAPLSPSPTIPATMTPVHAVTLDNEPSSAMMLWQNPLFEAILGFLLTGGGIGALLVTRRR